MVRMTLTQSEMLHCTRRTRRELEGGRTVTQVTTPTRDVGPRPSPSSNRAAACPGVEVAEQMFLIEARRSKRGNQPAGIARFIVTGGSRYAALSKLRVEYDTSDVDSLTATPISGVIPIAGALVHDMLRARTKPETPQGREGSDDDEPWKRSA